MAAPSAGSNAPAKPAEREVIITRVFDAPRALVFKAWTDPKQVARWWGPHGFTNPVCELDPRVGGAWRIVMRAANGAEYPCGGVYREVVEPERLVFTNIAMDKEGNYILDGLTKVLFVEHGGKTTLTLQTRATAVVAYAAEYLQGMEAGWTQSLERLEADVAKTRKEEMTMTEKTNVTAEAPADREIAFTRIFDAPRELVFQAWTDPQHVIHWWGPNGFTTTIQEMDVRPGGVWKHIMHGPDGTDYPNYSVFTEVVKPERLAYSHGGAKKGGPAAEFQATVTFENQGGKTKLTMRMLFPSAAQRDQVVKAYGAIEGGNQTMDRLSGYLLKMDRPAAEPAGRPFAITRVFNAPRNLVWQACADPERLKHWWGPKGFTWVSSKMDLRPGGLFHYCMRSPDGSEMGGKFVYREIVEPERLVFVNSFSDKDANATRNPWNPAWPLEVLNTQTFAEHEGKTTIKLQGVPVNATEEEHKTFEAGFESMQKGFAGTLDQLADYLAKVYGSN